MGNKKSRRKLKSGHSLKRRKPGAKSSSVGDKISPEVKSKGREIFAVLFFALSLFVGISLLSFHNLRAQDLGLPSDPAFSGQSQNFMGPTGHFVATILYGFLGWAAWLPVLWLSYSSVALLLPGASFWKLSRKDSGIALSSQLIIGLVGTLLAAACLASAVWGAAAGGNIGRMASLPLITLFGQKGTIVLTSLFLVFFISFSINQGIVAFLSSTARTAYLAIIAISGFLAFLFVRIADVAHHARRWLAAALPLMNRSAGVYESSSRRNRVGEEAALIKRRRSELHKELEEEKDVRRLVMNGPPRDIIVRRKNASTYKPKATKGETAEKSNGYKSGDFFPYEIPAINLLTRGEASVGSEDDKELLQKSAQIVEKLRDFSILGQVTAVHPGPVITLFEFEPAAGIKVNKIAALQDDLSMSLRASSIRIIAPIPKRGTVGIEVPNRQRNIVRLRDLLESDAFISANSTLSIPLGKDTYGDPVVADIATMPHLLMAGATGTGKSVCINALLLSLLYRATPEELGLILIDPKILELSVYDGIPHLRVPVVTVPRQARAVLEWAVKEMERRYKMMQRYGVRNIDSYNRIVSGEKDIEVEKSGEPVISLKEELVVEPGSVEGEAGKVAVELFTEKLEPLQKIVIVIDELADLMLTVGRDIEELITRLAQKARAAGIHLIVATQRPSVDVITGLIKANFPARLSFRVSSRIDSRTILDSMGAEKLLGRGDMLFIQPGVGFPRRVHGAYVADSEVKKVVDFIKKQGSPNYDQRIMDLCARALEEEESSRNGGTSTGGEDEYDAVYDDAVQLVLEKGHASTSMIQRVFRIGYNRAARIIETMEKEGIVGPMDGSRPREVLSTTQQEEN